MAEEDDLGFIPNEDDEWKIDPEENADEFPMEADNKETAPAFSKQGSGAEVIFVTHQTLPGQISSRSLN